MLLQDIDPFVRYIRLFPIMQASQTAGKCIKTRDNRIFFVTDGEGTISLVNEHVELKRDTLVYIKAGEEYKITPTPKLTVIVINFDFTENFSSIRQSFHPFHANFPGALEDISFDDTDAFSSHLITLDTSGCERKMRDMLSEFRNRGTWSDSFLSSSLKALLLGLARRKSESTGKKQSGARLASRIAEYICENCAERVENETLSSHFHFSPVYLNRVFRREYGTSIHQYLISVRINVAKELLSTGEHTPSQTATLTGFEDYPHFSKTFKRLVGKSPKEYQADAFN